TPPCSFHHPLRIISLTCSPPASSFNLIKKTDILIKDICPNKLHYILLSFSIGVSFASISALSASMNGGRSNFSPASMPGVVPTSPGPSVASSNIMPLDSRKYKLLKKCLSTTPVELKPLLTTCSCQYCNVSSSSTLIAR